jgi:long-chain fatty acid transport protein
MLQMITCRCSRLGWTAACLALLLCSDAPAQVVIEPPAVNPGARSLGFGGAFVAVADDATAAWSNPSGLMQLLRPEISAEGRKWKEDREGLASNQSRLGFLSFVLPRRSWSIAFYGQTMSSLEFPEEWSGEPGELGLLSSLVIANVGATAAFRVSDTVSIGFGLTAFVGASTVGLTTDPSSYPFFEDDVQTDPGATAGVMWNLGEAWALGASVRTGADFTFANGTRAVFPDIVSAGARWTSAGGNATVAAEIEHLGGLENRLRPHLGGEWVFLKSKPLIGLRAGVWYDPEGGVVTDVTGGGPTIGDGVVHVSAGIGFAWRKFQLDLAGDYSDRTTITSISGIFTF